MRGRGGGRAATLAGVGPAFVAAIAYVDPGNVATNTAAGARYGSALLWVVVLATAMAAPVQYLSAKLGVVTGRSLPRTVADRTRSRPRRLAYWAQAEFVAIATDVAEVVGAAVGLHLLFGVPLVAGGLIAGAAGLVLLAVRDRRGDRWFEGVCVAGLLVIGAGFAVGLLRVPPDAAALAGGLVPSLDDAGAVLLAAGIVGATVMPHAVYLHSALTARHQEGPDQYGSALETGKRPVTVATRLQHTRWDVGLAMCLAGGINVAMLVLGASVLAGAGDLGLAEAHALIGSSAGEAAAAAFGTALLVSGLTSTAVGTQAGAAIMDGLLRRRIRRTTRRLVALAPALLLLAAGAEPLEILVLSQVGLALGLPFALVPLVRATGDRRLMGEHTNRLRLHCVAWAVTAVVVTLDLALVVLTVG